MSARWIRRAAAAAILLATAGADAQTQPAPEKRAEEMTLEELRAANQRRALGEMAKSLDNYSRDWPPVIQHTCEGQIIDLRAKNSRSTVLKPRLPVGSCVAQNLALIDPITKMMHPNATSLDPTDEAWADAKRMKLCIDAFEFKDQPWPGQPPFTRIEAFPAMLMECVSALRHFVPIVGPIPAPPVVKPIALGGPNPGREAYLKHTQESDWHYFGVVIDSFCGGDGTSGGWAHGAAGLPYATHALTYSDRYRADKLCREANAVAIRTLGQFVSLTQHTPLTKDIDGYYGDRLVNFCRRKMEKDYDAPLLVLPCVVTLDRLFESPNK